MDGRDVYVLDFWMCFVEVFSDVIQGLDDEVPFYVLVIRVRRRDQIKAVCFLMGIRFLIGILCGQDLHGVFGFFDVRQDAEAFIGFLQDIVLESIGV